MGFLDILKQFSPLNEAEATPEEIAAQSAAPAPKAAPIIEAPAAANPNLVTEKTVDGLMGHIAQPRNMSVRVPQVDISQYDVPVDEGRQNEFKSSLESLKDEYKKAQEDARSRQMKVEMMNALKDNIGTIVGGAQAMNTKASVTPYQGKPSTTPDFVGRADKNFKDNYSNLLKQYKDLQDGGLSAKDKLYADISNKQMQMQGIRAEINADNQDRNIGMRFGSSAIAEQEKGEMSDKQLEAGSDMEKAIVSGDLIGEKAKDFEKYLGPIASRTQDLQRGIVGSILPGESDPKFTEFTADVERMAADYRKVISGLTVSDKEKESLNKSIPNTTDRYEDFMAKQRSFVSNLRRAKAISEHNIKTKQGKNVAGYTDPSSQGAPKTGPYGETTTKGDKTYKWNPAAQKYQLVK